MRSITALVLNCCLLVLCGIGCAPEPPPPIALGLLPPRTTLPREVVATELFTEGQADVREPTRRLATKRPDVPWLTYLGQVSSAEGRHPQRSAFQRSLASNGRRGLAQELEPR